MKTNKIKPILAKLGVIFVFPIMVGWAFTTNGKLKEAAHDGNAPEVKRLLDNGANVNYHDDSWTPLMAASAGGHTEVVKILINAKADLNTKAYKGGGETALMIASQWCVADVVKILIDAKADLEVKDDNGSTALIYAANAFENECPNVVKMLVNANADLNVYDKYHDTALKKALSNKYENVVNMLKQAGASEE